jgi:WD40 repeat protein
VNIAQQTEVFNNPDADTFSGFERNLAFIIGINEYQNGISPLKTAVNDAKKLVEVLREKHKYQVWVCLDSVATLSNLNKLLEETLPAQVTEHDRLLFYFAGHGVALNGDDGPAGYLIPQDAKGGDTSTYLPMTKLHDALSKLPCRHFLGILDCCFAGAFRWSSTRDLITEPEVIYKERYDRFIRDAAWQIITSSASDQKALDNFSLDTERGQVGNHSPFATALLEALEGAADASPPAKNGKPAGDGVITANELYTYLRDRVEISTEKYSRRQTPGIWYLNKHDKGEYIFLSPNHELNLPPAPPLDESKNPYRGLNSFEEEHSQLFFGRSELVEKLQDFVKINPLTVVLGASGSGKSSLVKAGLIPKLKQETDNKWCILPPIRPGETPFQALNKALVEARLTTVELYDKQKTLAQSIDIWAKKHPNSKLLIFIDQSEEIITLCQDDNQRKEFFQQVLTAINAHRPILRVVLSLRSDFERQVQSTGLKYVPTVLQLGDTVLKNRWQSGKFQVPMMKREELREAIEKPAQFQVMYFQPHNLVEQLIDEVADMPGALPLLSFALSELFLKYLKRQRYAQYRGENIERALTQEDYHELGGVMQSLTQRADEEYQTLVQENPAYEQVIRHVMLRMVAIGGGELARRRVPLSELEYPPDKNSLVQQVIEQFSQARLLVKGQDAEGNPYVEPAHDALVKSWDKIQKWQQQEQEYLPLQRRLTPAAIDWKTKEQSKSLIGKAEPILTWFDKKIDSAENWFNKPKEEAKQSSLEKKRQFLWNSNPYLDVLKKKLKSVDYWFNQVEAEFVQQSVWQRRRNINLRWSIAVGITTLSIGLTFWALSQQRDAEIGQIDSSRQASEALFLSNQQLDALISSTRSGKNLSNPLLQTFPPNSQLQEQVLQTLRKVFYGMRERKRWEPVPGMKVKNMFFHPSGELFIATKSNNGTVQLWNMKTKGQPILELPGHKFKVDDSSDNIFFSPDASKIATVDSQGIVRLWDWNGKRLGSDLRAGYQINKLSFSPNGQFFITEGYENKDDIPNGRGVTIKSWNLQGRYKILPSNVIGANFKSDSSIVSANQNHDKIEERDKIELFGLSNKAIPIPYVVPNAMDGKVEVSFSPNSNYVVLTSSYGDSFSTKIRKWNGKSLEVLESDAEKDYIENAQITSFSSDSKLVAFTNNNTVRIYNLSTFSESSINFNEIKLPSGTIQNTTFSKDGKSIATQSENGTVRWWDVYPPQLEKSKQYQFLQNDIQNISFSPDNKTIATVSNNGTAVRLLDLNGKQLSEFPITSGKITSISFSPDSKTIVTGNENGTVSFFNQSGKKLEPIKVHSKNVKSVVFSLDGQRLGTLGSDGKEADGSDTYVAKLWRLNGGKLELEKTSEEYVSFYKVRSVKFKGNEDLRLVTEIDDNHMSANVSLWKMSGEQEEILPVETKRGHSDSIAFSPDDSLLARVDTGTNIIGLWNLQNRNLLMEFKDNECNIQANKPCITSINFSPDGSTLAIIRSNGSAKLLQLGSLNELLAKGCYRMRDYLTNLDENNNNHRLCDSIGNFQR